MPGSGGTSDERASAIVGRTIAGKFLVMSYLGGGGVGAVYKAKQLALDKDVAIKLLHGEHAGDAMFAGRFEREAKAASKLDHPNSMRVLDFGVEPDGVAYIAMEYLDGRHLLGVMEDDWPLAPERVADIACQALAAVGAASALGIVHRDLKPENIMILQGTDDEGTPRDVVKVCDFGIAKFIEDHGTPVTGEKLTKHGMMLGTPEYMSPEQCMGDPLDVRSDLYSMGVILYQLLTGRTPFIAETALGIVMKHINEEAPPPSTFNPDVDPRLEAVCVKAMRKNRALRYQTAREMRAELRAVVGEWAPEPTSTVTSLPEVVAIPSIKATKLGLAQPAPSVIVTAEPIAAPVVEVARTQRLRAREEGGPQSTRRMAGLAAREPRGPTGTVLLKGREGPGPTGTVLMKARGAAAGAPRAPSGVWLVVAAVLGVLVLGAAVWALARG